MTSGAAWNARPFRHETLEAAREAARRSGVSLAEWLNAAILDTAADAGVRASGGGFGTEDLDSRDDAVGIIAERLDELARRIDQLIKRGSEADARPPEGTPARSAPQIGTSLDAIETRLASILRELVPQSQAATQQLSEVIRDLNARLEGLGAITPAPGHFATHRAALGLTPGLSDEHPSKPHDRGAGSSESLELSAWQRELDAEITDAQDFSWLEQQLRELTQQIEARRRPGHPDTAAARTGDHPAVERIESKILELAHKLDASDARFDSLGAIERSIAELTFQLKETRAATIEEAERVARAVAAELLADSGAMGMEIDTLKQAFADLRANRAEIDHRTEDALAAIDDTLARLLERVAAIETGGRAGAPRLAEPQQLRVGSVSPSAPGSDAPPLNPPSPRLGTAQRPIDSDLPADHPLEPGSGAPRGRTSSPATRIAASEAVLANSVPAEPAAKADFIAAARRAAQAAAENPDAADPAVGPQDGGGIAAALTSRRRPLMIVAGALLFGTGGLHAALNGHLPTLASLEHSFRSEAHRSAPGEARGPAGKVKRAAAPAANESHAQFASDPVVPESGPSATRYPSGATADEFVLAAVPGSTVMPAKEASVRESASSGSSPIGATRASDVTGSPAWPQTGASTFVGQRATRETTPSVAETLPNAIGNSALRSAAVAGNPAAEYEIGVRFSEGRGVPPSFESAAYWLARAADRGLAPAQYRLGSLYEKGHGVKKDLMEARRLYLAAAQQGNAKAMHNLAVLYAVGLEGRPDYKTASEWFQKAADHGVADSQYNLAILFARGLGVELNLTESYKWFALAAQQGDEDAAQKRDDLAARLDPQALVAARLAVQTWTVDPEPDKATKVEPPGGDGERAVPAAPSAKAKAGRRTGASGSA